LLGVEMGNQVIPILLLSRNNYTELSATIDSIINNTLFDYRLIIADNNSDDKCTVEYLTKLSLEGITVFRNKTNLWVLGLNKAIKWIEDNIDHEFIVVSDSDLLMPSIVGNDCWLTHLNTLMHKYPVLGKLGLSLSLDNIRNRPDLKHIYQGEMNYYEKNLFSDVYLAPVDTTTAIYRKDIFTHGKFRFYPGHGSYIKPYYHVGRVADYEAAYHLGWDNYNANRLVSKNINEKIKCFTIVGGYIDKVVLKRGSLLYRLFYSSMRHVFKGFWAARLFCVWFVYIGRNGVVNLNEIYKNSKKGY